MGKMGYTEPAEYIPKAIRKELKLGEFAEDDDKAKKETKEKTNQAIRDFVKGKK